ncbi:hypothetical protein AVEN_213889-1 [Araneus ventricosus]|uniref:Uncharacterized protein n=1 Tax=Araneus ventricosus TaxID=182803 RepID=A0A4Y2KFL8_ARAVE|nr:hypothetical protein AVEN_213889-1 [Araneus ventricosus]
MQARWRYLSRRNCSKWVLQERVALVVTVNLPLVRFKFDASNLLWQGNIKSESNLLQTYVLSGDRETDQSGVKFCPSYGSDTNAKSNAKRKKSNPSSA